VPASGQPIVADVATELVWQGCPAGMTGALSSCTGVAVSRTWQAALDYCQDLNWGGQTDWYLPNVKELRSIMDNSRMAPTIDTTIFPGTASDPFWTSSTAANDDNSAWIVEFSYGWAWYDSKGDAYQLRCVRSPS
jgi:hypothetical protein